MLLNMSICHYFEKFYIENAVTGSILAKRSGVVNQSTVINTQFSFWVIYCLPFDDILSKSSSVFRIGYLLGTYGRYEPESTEFRLFLIK